MAETETGGTNQPLNAIDHVPPMSWWEKCGFWFFPVGWTPMAAAFLLPSVFVLTAFSVLFVLHPHYFLAQSAQWKKEGAASLGILVALSVISGAALAYPVSVFRKMARRKKETGTIFPRGEELAARRLWWKNPPLGTKLAVVGFYVLIAVGATLILMASPYHRFLINWSLPAVLWILAGLAAIDCFFPRPERLWTGFGVSGVFGLLAILSAAAILHSRTAKIVNWVFPLLMAALSSGLLVGTVRTVRRQRFAAPSAGDGGR